MNSDIRIQVSFSGHRKRHHLEKLLGSIRATRYLVDLWLTAAQQRPDGNLEDWNEKDIAIAAGYTGKPQKFVDSLLESGFPDRDGAGYRLHDWAQHQPWCCGAPRRSEQARKAAAERWGQGGQPPDKGSTTPGHTPDKGRPSLGQTPSTPTSECKNDARSINEHMPLSASSPSPNRILSFPNPEPIPQPIPEPEDPGKALISQLPPAVKSFLEGYEIDIGGDALNDLLSGARNFR